MKLYERKVNYSVFDGEITLNKDAREHLLNIVFSTDSTNRDIELIINDGCYAARLMNVPSSTSVQISYGADVQQYLKKVFAYSYDYYKTSRAEAKRIGYSTRKIPAQTFETITISETDKSLVYKVDCSTYPFDMEQRESDDSISYPEGKPSYKKHICYERNQGVVKLAKEKFKDMHNGKLYCEVCGFSFMDRYGEEYIEAHHIIPVSELGEEGRTRVEDLRMVCSNCHCMPKNNFYQWYDGFVNLKGSKCNGRLQK